MTVYKNKGAPYVLIWNTLQIMLSEKCKVQKVYFHVCQKKKEGEGIYTEVCLYV